jgi:RNA-directed DNA polymerase
MSKHYRGNPFERYADDMVVHCRDDKEAQMLLKAISLRLGNCKLTVHPVKTKIVYCKDQRRTRRHENIEFDFLGYTFRPRRVKSNQVISF